MPSIEDLVIGESRDELEVSGVEEHRQVVFHMLRQATRTVDIVSRHLDRRLFDQRDLIDALRALATRNKRARIRLLVVDTGPLIRGEHRLVTLVKRLPTFFEIRGPGRTIGRSTRLSSSQTVRPVFTFSRPSSTQVKRASTTRYEPESSGGSSRRCGIQDFKTLICAR